MKAYRINISSWTASFRYPNLISGFQPSLPVPPPSTIYGLMSAAVGDYVSPGDISHGYIYSFVNSTIDLETIYQFGSNSLKTKPNVIRREILFDNELWLYVMDDMIADAFRKPCFQILLGRSNDLASINEVREVDLQPLNELSRLKGTAFPLGKVPMSAPMQALPVGFTNEIPRRSFAVRPFYLLDYDFEQTEKIEARGYLDPELDFEIYWHEYSREKENNPG
jgi:CRISPR-associated protein Cas5t